MQSRRISKWNDMDMGHGFFLCILLWTTTGVGQLATARDLGHFCYPSNYGWSENGAHGTPRIPLVDDQFPNIFTEKAAILLLAPWRRPITWMSPPKHRPKAGFFFSELRVCCRCFMVPWSSGAPNDRSSPREATFLFFLGGMLKNRMRNKKKPGIWGGSINGGTPWKNHPFIDGMFMDVPFSHTAILSFWGTPMMWNLRIMMINWQLPSGKY